MKDTRHVCADGFDESGYRREEGGVLKDCLPAHKRSFGCNSRLDKFLAFDLGADDRLLGPLVSFAGFDGEHDPDELLSVRGRLQAILDLLIRAVRGAIRAVWAIDPSQRDTEDRRECATDPQTLPVARTPAGSRAPCARP